MAYLMHHGIKGQRWGVRRFRNTDGTLTDAGKKRYSDSDSGTRTSKPQKKRRMTVEGGFRKASRITRYALSSLMAAYGTVEMVKYLKAKYGHNPKNYVFIQYRCSKILWGI